MKRLNIVQKNTLRAASAAANGIDAYTKIEMWTPGSKGVIPGPTLHALTKRAWLRREPATGSPATWFITDAGRERLVLCIE